MADVWERIAPLSYQQERMYLFEGLDSGASVNNLACVHWLDGDLDVPALTAAIAELHRRHEILRTRYPDGSTQTVSTPDHVEVPAVDLTGCPDPAAEVVRRLDESLHDPFDLATEAPARWSLHTLGPDRHALTLVVHHIVYDGWSKSVINTELSSLYQTFHTGTEPVPPQQAVQYGDYATRQRGRDLSADLDQWAGALAGAPAAVALPFDRPPHAGTGFAGSAHHPRIPEPLLRAAERLGAAQRASTFMVLLAAFAGLLARRGGTRDLVIGVPTAGRGELDLEPLVGCFADTVPFRVRLAGLTTFRELLAHVRDVTLDIHDRPEVPLAQLVAALGPRREPGREPLVQVVFQVLNTPMEPLRLTGLTVTEESREPTSTDVDLTLSIGAGPGGPGGLWRYKTELFDAGTIETLHRDFLRILERAVEDVDVPLADLLGVSTVDAARPAEDGAVAAGGPAPRTAVERLVAQIWTEILEIEDVTVADSFFDLGGHSLTASQVVARIGELLPAVSTRGLLRDVLRHPVLAEFATVLADRMASGVIAAAHSTDTASAAERIPVISRDRPLPLSYGQRRLWFQDQFLPESTDYLVPMAARITGELDVAALTAALREIVDRHEVLRTGVTVVDDEPVGLVRPAGDFTVELVEPDDPADLTEARLAEMLVTMSYRPFDLEHGLPIRAGLIRLGECDHVLCLSLHHMAFDGWSTGIFFAELDTLYGAFAAGLPSPLAPLRLQYADVAAYQQARVDSSEAAATLEFWRHELDGAAPFELAPDLPRPPRRTEPTASRLFAVDPEVTGKLERLASGQGATLFMALLTAWQTLLYRYSGATDIALGTPAAERDVTESEPLIGFFINMLVLRGDLSGGPTFTELLARTRDRTLDAYANQDMPFDRLVAELGGERDLSRTPFFQIVVKLISGRGREATLPGLTVRPVTSTPIPAKYDLELDFIHRDDGGLTGELRYDPTLYLPATVERLTGHLTTLLGTVASDPATPIDHLELADPDERARALALTARPEVRFPDRCLHELVEDQVARTPDAIAVVDDEDRLTYAELDAWANRIAGLLRRHGVGPDVVVGVLLDRSVGMAAALLGVLKAGGAYLPIETDTPTARIATLLADGRAPACLVSAAHAGLVAEAGGTPLVLPDRDGPVIAWQRPGVRPADLVAVYYTSGSTGRPKGVANTHAGWVNRMCWMRRHHPLRAGETVLHKTTLTFDDAAVEIFWPLMVGARVAMLGPGLHRDPRAIADAAIRHRAVHLQFVPSMLDLFLETLTDADTARLGELRSVLSSGEALRPALVRRFRDRFGDRVMLDNTWGATEVSIDSTCRVCRPEDGHADGGAVSIGVPIDNNEVLVLDPRMATLPIGVSGELFIGGVGLARGYLGDPRRTAESFLPHPFRPGERIYRTGDWGRLAADGSLIFQSRRDDQVKVRGVRIELGEVEHALRVHPSVADAAVIAWEAVPGDKRLAAYVVVRAGTDCSTAHLADHVRDLLPGYAVPGSIAIVVALPRHSNGKLDRRGLPAPEVQDGHDETSVAPRTSAERIVAEIWSAVLGLDRMGVNEDFFAAGGHSLLATRAIGRMRQAFTPALPLTLMFECPTPARAAAAIEEILLAEIAELSDEQARELLGQS